MSVPSQDSPQGSPHDLEAWEAVEDGVELIREGFLDEAQAFLEGLEASQPDNAYVHAHLGHIAFQKEHFAAALKHYVQALKLQPRFLSVSLGCVWTLRHLNRSDEAVRLAVEALRFYPEDSDLLYALGTLHHARGELTAARHFLEAWRKFGRNAEQGAVVSALLADMDGPDPDAIEVDMN